MAEEAPEMPSEEDREPDAPDGATDAVSPSREGEADTDPTDEDTDSADPDTDPTDEDTDSADAADADTDPTDADTDSADADTDSAEADTDSAEAADADTDPTDADTDPTDADTDSADADPDPADAALAALDEASAGGEAVDASDPFALAASAEGFDATTPAATTISAGLSTLQDVRLGLLSEVEDEQADVLRRNLAKAEQRVELLLAQGHDPTLLEGRLAAAQNLHAAGESRSALLLVEELLVLAKTMLECGPLPQDPALASAVAAAAARLVDDEAREAEPGEDEPPAPSFLEVAALLEHEHAEALAHHRREIEAAQIRTEEELELLRERELPALRYETRRAQERALDDLRADLERKGKARLEARLSELLSEERFAAAAAHATAARPSELIDRPEFLARVDAVASRLDGAVLERAEIREAVDAKVREVLLRFIRGGDLARAIKPIVAEQGAPDVAEQLRVLERQEKLLRRQGEALSGLQSMLEAERARAGQRDARLAKLEERLAEAEAALALAKLEENLEDAEAALSEVDVSGQVRESLAEALAGPEFRARVGKEVERHLANPAFGERVAGLSQESVARELQRPERVAGLVAAVVAAKELVQRVLASKELEARLGQERQRLIELEAFAKRVQALMERALPESSALRARVLELLDDEGTGGPIIDQRIDDRVAEKTDSLLDQRSVARRITGAVRAEMVEEVFRKNVDARIHELAEEGYLAKRIKAILTQEMGPALDAALSNSEVLRRLVLKEIRNREALQTAQLTGDGLSDPATALIRSGAMDELLEDKIREALRGRSSRSSRSGQPPSEGGKKSTKDASRPAGDKPKPSLKPPGGQSKPSSGKKGKPSGGKGKPPGGKPSGGKGRPRG